MNRRAGTVCAAGHQEAVGVGDVFGGFAGGVGPVMAQQGLEGARQKEVERGVAGKEVSLRLLKRRGKRVNSEGGKARR